MRWLSVLIQAGLSQAAIRFACSTVSIQRLDPLVEPGNIPSAHIHQIVGGNAFNATMTGDIGEQADCTTCAYSEVCTTGIFSPNKLAACIDTTSLGLLKLLDRRDVL